jgi:hypothetical protein
MKRKLDRESKAFHLKTPVESKNRSLAIALLLLSLFIAPLASQEVIDPTSLNHKIMAGYQGWFAAPGDGSGYGWIHWGGPTIDADNITIDMWPDMREYDPDELFETDFVYQDLTNAGLYSAYTRKTVERHVKWMKDYGIDGVFVQRFLGSTARRRDLRDTVLQNVRYGAEKYGRVFANMYDISGGDSETMVEWMKNDWMHLVDDLKILESPNYLHHNGRPVLSIWGFGLNGRPGTPAIAEEIIDWFTRDAPEPYRVTLKGGVDDKWQSHSAAWQAAYEKFDILSPWSVGRYGDIAGADNFRESKIEPDLARTQSKNIDYMPVVFPGFSWYNLKEGTSELNKRPRNGGKFLWRQFFNAVDAGCNMVYVAMFDEVDEGTAIYKLAENDSQTPTTGKFVTLDMDGFKLPSDWYLRLTGEASAMLRNEIGLTSEIPIVAYPNSAEFTGQEVPATMPPGHTTSVEIVLKNTGTTTWTKGANYRLDYAVDSAMNTWGPGVVELEEADAIAPGESKTFTFDITAPDAEGAYKFQWSLLQEGVGWIDNPSPLHLIRVTGNPDYLDDCDDEADWNSSGSLELNTADMQQGSGCIEFSGGPAHQVEFEKEFATPYASNLTAYDAALRFWYYISDPTLSPNGLHVSLGSQGASGEDAYSWVVDNLSAGWNLLTLHVSEAGAEGVPDLDALDGFALRSEKTGELTCRLDGVQVFDKNSGSVKFELLVNNGSGSGRYVEDAIVEIVADEAPVGTDFSAWKVNTGNPLFEDDKKMRTRVRVRNSPVEISAEYKMFGAYLDDCDDLDAWGSSGSLALNAADQQEGAGCIEFSGNNTDEFKKAFDTPYNSGVSVGTGRLEFWYYVSDASLMGNNQVELGSAGRPDQQEYHWKLSGLTNGWNFISLPMNQANITGEAPDLGAINWFRIYDFKSGSITTRIDAIEIVDPDAGAKYPLTIRQGAGDGSYYEGTKVKIVADPAPGNQEFDQWIIESGNPLFEDILAPGTTLTMGPGSTVVRASYQEIVSTGNTPELKDEIRVYPNPVRTELSVEFRLEDLTEITISLIDLTGRPVGDVYRRSGMHPGNHLVVLSVEGVVPGMYFLKLRMNGRVHAEMIMIQE